MTPVSLAHSRQGDSRVIQPRGVNASRPRNFAAIEPPTLASVLKNAQDGDLEDWADLVSYVLRTDTHVRSVWATRVNAVASSRLVVEPAQSTETLQGVADLAAEFVQEQLTSTEEFEDRIADLMHGAGVGIAVLEHHQRPKQIAFNGQRATAVTFTPLFVHPRDLKYTQDWRVQARTFDERGRPVWIALDDYPGKFIVHRPHNFADHSTVTGELMPIMWAWLFRRTVEKYGVSGFERLANGLLFGMVAENSTDLARRTLREGLENATSQGVGIIEQLPGGQFPIHLLEPSKDPGASAIELLKYYNGEISKAILGSGLNVEVGDTGGNRALGESQFDTTILPRLKADARRIAGTLERDWVRPLLAANRHLFGGVMPPVPRVVLGEETEKAESQASVGVTQLAVQAGVITRDELRLLAGLSPVGAEAGGEELVSIDTGGGVSPFSVEAADVPAEEPGRPRIDHRPGGEWAVLDSTGDVIDAYATKAEAVEKLRELLSGGAANVPFLNSLKRDIPKGTQLSLPIGRGSTPTPSTSPSPLAIALSEK